MPKLQARGGREGGLRRGEELYRYKETNGYFLTAGTIFNLRENSRARPESSAVFARDTFALLNRERRVSYLAKEKNPSKISE